jgi:tetratricopeptide (TPR) repeat protein
MLVQKLITALRSLFSIKLMAALIPLIALVLAIRTGWRDNSQRMLRFQPFEVAPSFVEAGYSALNTSRAVVDEVYAVRDSAGSLSQMTPVRSARDRELPSLDIEVEGQAISLTTLYRMALAMRPDSSVDIQGELLRADSLGQLVIRVGLRSKRIPFPAKSPEIPRATLRAAAEFILLQTEPYILASYFMNSDPPRARVLLDQLTRAREPRVRAQALLGQAFLASKTNDTSVSLERQFRLSLSADPSYAGPYVNLAAIYNHRERDHEALAVLDSVPADMGGWTFLAANNRSSILNSLGRHEEALHYARKAAALEDGLGPRLNAADALLGMGKYSEALVELEQAEVFVPSYKGAALLKALALGLKGRTEHAHDLLARTRADTALTFSADLIGAMLVGQDSGLALARTEQGNVRPQQTAALFARVGYLLLIAQRPAEAKSYLQEAERLDGRNQLIQWRLGQAACVLGDSTSAAKHLNLVVQFDTVLYGPLTANSSASRCDSHELMREERPTS